MNKDKFWHNIDSMNCKSKEDMLDKMNILCKLNYHAEFHLNKYTDNKDDYGIIYIVDTNKFD